MGAIHKWSSGFLNTSLLFLMVLSSTLALFTLTDASAQMKPLATATPSATVSAPTTPSPAQVVGTSAAASTGTTTVIVTPAKPEILFQVQDGDPVAFFASVITAIRSMGGLSTMMKISTVILLLIASMKVSVLNKYVWSRLDGYQVWAAPVLGLLAGIFGLGAKGAPITGGLIFAYITAGGGAVFMHEILDSLKNVPSLGPIYLKAITIAENALGGGPESKV